MGSVTTMTVFVWVLNIMVALSQIAMVDINPESNIFYSDDGSVLEKYSQDSNFSMPEGDVSSEFDVASSGEVSEDDGSGIFVIDAIASVKNWITGKAAYFTAIVMGPYNIINSIDVLPQQFVTLVSLLWYGVSILLLLLTIFGRAT